MANNKPLRIGLIGGGFMGRTHSNGYNRIRNFFPELVYQPQLKAVCSRNPQKVRAFAEQWGYESFETEWQALVNRHDIETAMISTP
jgi:predicted dehydrogenase